MSQLIGSFHTYTILLQAPIFFVSVKTLVFLSLPKIRQRREGERLVPGEKRGDNNTWGSRV